MEKLELYTHDEMLNRVLGKKGTPLRDEHDNAISDFIAGDVIKKIRILQDMTQEQLGEKVGVKKSQVSKIENGHSISYANARKFFQALGVKTASIDLGPEFGKYVLW